MNKAFLFVVSGLVSLLILPVVVLGAPGRECHVQQKNGAIAQDSFRTEVRLKMVYEGRLVTPLIEIYVDNQKFDAIFDTGSSGLRVLNGVLKGEVADSARNRTSYGYGDPKRYFGIRGQVQPVNIRLGKLKSRKPVRIMRIDSTRYGRTSPWTPVGDSTTIRSNHFRSVSAMMGVGLRLNNTKGIANPLAQLPGNGKYIVKFPYFDLTKGKLILNPDSADLKGFTLFKLESGKNLFPNGDSSWRDNELSGCVIINDKIDCQGTLLDTGSPDIHVRSKTFTGFNSLPMGNKIVLTLKDKAGISEPIQTGFTVSSMRENGKDYVYLDETTAEGTIVFGTRFFFDFDVMYDQVNGVIGIKKK